MTGSTSSLGLLRLPAWVSTRNGLSAGIRLMLAGAALVAIVLSSVLLYAMFYRLYVPTLLHQAPVYLQYDRTGLGNTTAMVSFVPERNYKFLSTSQAYAVALDLRVPTSAENRRLGNFMVYLELCNGKGVPVHQSSRPAILRYRSGLIWHLRTLIQAPLVLLNWWQEDESLHIDLIDVMYDRHFSPINFARISLSKPLQVYSASIVIRAQFTGLRYWMYYWRLPTALVFVSIAVVWQLVFTAIAWSVLESYAGKTSSLGGPHTHTTSAITGASKPLSLSQARSRSRSQSASRTLSVRRRKTKSCPGDTAGLSLPLPLSLPSDSGSADDNHDVPHNLGPASKEHVVPE
ncbi:hypothetical protein LPJ64_000993 [Coemansia asiatica]|uniref:Seipin n=1 Tax=Coemansia asiatica TaxID=1052880 RepID=A0A9W7XQU9_9FUNG|nr:hypothetical protein LPJ64_000993 [Coemansia asiatica]